MVNGKKQMIETCEREAKTSDEFKAELRAEKMILRHEN